ncbi:general secretion pathway protein GspB [Aquincola sp. MAHUQ-54]|uniref:General secretion pathway protein GspB n=1 Tax=Aquincola agrisoli TaxID=3119538 RepID=A0AAW9QG78_9BURK
MSLVLEALKKADAERERERTAVPDLNARQLPAAPLPERHRPAVVAWSVAGVAVIAATALGWQAMRRESPAVAAAPPPAAVPSPVAPAAVPAPPPTVARAPAPPAAPRAPVPPPAPRPAAQPSPAAETLAAPPPPATAAAPAEAPETRIYDSMQALPEEARRGLPALTMGGAMYSESPANRMLIVNGQVFREKDVLAPDLVLEQIALKSAVLRYRTYRFRVTY